MLEKAGDVWTFLSETFWPFIRDTLWPKLQEFATDVLKPVWDGFSGAADAVGRLISKITELGGLKDILANVGVGLLPFIGRSPSPLEKGLRGINQQLGVLANTRLPTIANLGPQMHAAMSPTQMLSPVTNTSVTMNMGGNTFNSGLDSAAHEAHVEQAMRRLLRR
jgi:hypothetical protein